MIEDKRKELSDAIDELNVAGQNLADARAAHERATQTVYAEARKLEALEAEAEGADAGDADLVAALAAGEDIATISRPREDLKAKIEAQRETWQAWRRARDAAKAMLPAREAQLAKARAVVDGLARAVVAESVGIDAVLAEARDAADRLIAARLQLRWLSAASEREDEIQRYLNAPIFEAEVIACRGRPHVATQPYEAAVEALKADSDAVLPWEGA